jgi:hypothetical protein
MLPLRLGQVERHTHDYERHGTTRLFAALEVGTGKVTTQARACHTGEDFLALPIPSALPRRARTAVRNRAPTGPRVDGDGSAASRSRQRARLPAAQPEEVIVRG